MDRAAAACVLIPLAAAIAMLILKPDGLSSAFNQRSELAQTPPAAPNLQSHLGTSSERAEIVSNAPLTDESADVARSKLSIALGSVPVEAVALVERPAEDLPSAGPPHEQVLASTEDIEDLDARERRCELEDHPVAPATSLLSALAKAELSAIEFGLALAEAALAQTRDFVVYTDSYKRLSFPLGDVSAQFGVCTDVIIRAYRALGVDLQALVHRAGVGSGDSSIDHRRTETLRRFFSTHGITLPTSDVAQDYLPGDIVTYYRPQNNGSQSHIAVVANVVGYSGRPLIIHNRGWGPQLEDALFVDDITGHYRYAGSVGGEIETVVKLRGRAKRLSALRRSTSHSAPRSLLRRRAAAGATTTAADSDGARTGY
ncbi:MAG: DUF1287 domain-containing protein [Hyphomicrobium sp.]